MRNRRYASLISCSFARKCGLSPSDAEDVLQEVVLKVFRAMPTMTYDRAKGTFRAYLRTITQRQVVNYLKKAARYVGHESNSRADGNGHRPLDDPTSEKAEELWERDWRRNLVLTCLDRVRREVEPKTYQAFELYALQEWPVRDVATFLRISTSSVYTAKSRISQRLRVHLEQEMSEE